MIRGGWVCDAARLGSSVDDCSAAAHTVAIRQVRDEDQVLKIRAYVAR